MKLTSKLLKKLIKEQMDSEAILDKIRQLAANKDLSSLLTKDQILALTSDTDIPDAAILAAIDPLHFIDDAGGWDKYDLGRLPEPGPHQPSEDELDDLYNTYGPAPEELSPAEQYAWYKKEYEQEPTNEENQMKITTEMLRKMIQEEIADLKEYGGANQDLMFQMMDDEMEFRELLHKIKRDNPGISDKEALSMARKELGIAEPEPEPPKYKGTVTKANSRWGYGVKLESSRKKNG